MSSFHAKNFLGILDEKISNCDGLSAKKIPDSIFKVSTTVSVPEPPQTTPDTRNLGSSSRSSLYEEGTREWFINSMKDIDECQALINDPRNLHLFGESLLDFPRLVGDISFSLNSAPQAKFISSEGAVDFI